jgi:hypothetical protein
MPELPLVPILRNTTASRIIPGGQCQVLLDVRPDGFTVVAQVKYATSRAVDEAPDEARSLLDGVLGRVEAFLGQVRAQLETGSAVELAPVEDLAADNRQLREALRECVTACEPLLERTETEAGYEGWEGEHAQAWLAIDAAREVLARSAEGEDSPLRALAGPSLR